MYDAYLKTYFDTAVRQNRYYSEDWTFCENWRDLGGKIWIDKRVLLRHTGTYTYCMENQEHLLKTIGPMYSDYQKQVQANAELAAKQEAEQAAAKAAAEAAVVTPTQTPKKAKKKK